MAKSPEEIRTLFTEHGRRANRALGQNFCTDPALLSRAAEAARLDGAAVLEIGPGLGALTEELLKHAASVVAVEKDAFLAELLPTLLPDEKLTVVTGDILKQDIRTLMGTDRFSVAGNLPYYITTPIVELLLPLLPDTLLLMVQKEAAARFFAAAGDRVYGATAILSQVYYRAQHLFDVPPHSYYPQPEVDSSVVLLTKKPQNDALPAPRELLGFVNRALAMRRKTLVNNFGKDERIHAALAQLGLDAGIRAETLAPEPFAALCSAYLAK